MRNFIKNWVIHNLLFKIVALIAAAVIWILFMNSSDPIKSYSTYVPVEILHEDEFLSDGRFLEIDGTEDFSKLNLEVYLRARTSVIDSLGSRDPSSFVRAYVDLYELSSDSNRLIIHYELTDSSLQADLYAIRNRTYLEVDVEENITKTIQVDYRITGNPADGYTYIKNDPDIVVTPSTINLTGPASQLEEIDHALISISVAEASANVNRSGQLSLLDPSGRTVTYSRDVIYESASEASVFVPIYKFKSVSVLPKLGGSAPEGFEYVGDVTTDITTVQIYGPEAIVNTVQSITLPEIDISSIQGEYSQSFNVQEVLDENYGTDVLELMSDSPKSVEVSFSVAEQITLVETYQTADITIYGLPDNMELKFDHDTVDITLFGLAENIEAFDVSDMSVILRLSALNNKAGTYAAALEVNGLSGIQYRAVTVQITLTEKEIENDTKPEGTALSGTNNR